MNLKNLLSVAALAPLALSGAAMADTQQGELSTSSSNGEVMITTTVPRMVMVSGLQDMDFGTYAPGATAITNGYWENEQVFCVFRNSDAAHYSITFDGSVTPGEFSLAGSGSNELEYEVDFSDDSSIGSGSWGGVSAGDEVTGQQVGNNGAIDCSNAGARTAGLKVKFLETDIQTAFDDTYTGDLKITVQPE